MQQFEAFYLKTKNSPSHHMTSQSENKIRKCLSNTQYVSDWLLASTVVSRIQNRYVVLNGHIKVWNECRTRAQFFRISERKSFVA